MGNMTKYIYVTWKFKYPIWLTATHMVASFGMSAIAIHGCKLVPNRRVLSFKEQVQKVAPFGLLGASSIACGNTALVYLYPSLHEMLQNSTPAFTLIFSRLLVGKAYNTAAYASLVPITFGGALCAVGEPSAILVLGLIASLLAVVFRALRTVLQERLLRGEDPIDSLTLLFYTAPFNLLLFLLASSYKERVQPWTDILEVPRAGQVFIAITACTAALFNLFNFL